MSFSPSAPHGDYSHSALRFARTQREAGLEWHHWEGRLKPLRPLSRDIAIVVFGLLAAAAIIFGFSLV